MRLVNAAGLKSLINCATRSTAAISSALSPSAVNVAFKFCNWLWICVAPVVTPLAGAPGPVTAGVAGTTAVAAGVVFEGPFAGELAVAVTGAAVSTVVVVGLLAAVLFSGGAGAAFPF